MLLLLFYFPELGVLFRDECYLTLKCTADRDRLIFWEIGDNQYPADPTTLEEEEDLITSTRTFLVNEPSNITCLTWDTFGSIQEQEMLMVDPSEGLWCSLLTRN